MNKIMNKIKRIDPLQKKILITLGLLILFKFLSFLPTPYIEASSIELSQELDFLNLVGLLNNSAMQPITFMATGVSAYITASIILQALSFAIKPLHEMSKTVSGQKKMKRFTMVLAVFVALITSVSLTMLMQSQYKLMTVDKWYAYMTIAIYHAIGTIIAVYIGEKITEDGFGNGLSILIATNVVTTIPLLFIDTFNSVLKGSVSIVSAILGLLIILIIFLVIVMFESSELKLPVQYSQAMNRGTAKIENFPLKINMNGIMPVILTTSLLQVTSSLASLFPENALAVKLVVATSKDGLIYYLIFIGAIYLFSSFYNYMTFDPKEVSENIQNSGGILLGVRVGNDTAIRLKEVTKTLTIVSTFFLSAIVIIPTILFGIIGVQGLQATSLMIVIGVATEVMDAYVNEKRIRKNEYRRKY